MLPNDDIRHAKYVGLHLSSMGVSNIANVNLLNL